jgi:phospholipid-transporting ATPase
MASVSTLTCLAQVGDIVRLESNDFIPADLVLLASSEPEGLCYIETSNLDGCALPSDVINAINSPIRETNLKIKQASPQTSALTAPHLVSSLRGSLRSEQPNNSLYTFEGTLDLVTPNGTAYTSTL